MYACAGCVKYVCCTMKSESHFFLKCFQNNEPPFNLGNETFRPNRRLATGIGINSAPLVVIRIDLQLTAFPFP